MKATAWVLIALGTLTATWCVIGLALHLGSPAINGICLPLNVGYVVYAIHGLRAEKRRAAAQAGWDALFAAVTTTQGSEPGKGQP